MEWERSGSAAETIVTRQRAFFIMFYSSPQNITRRETPVFQHIASVVCFFSATLFFSFFPPYHISVLSRNPDFKFGGGQFVFFAQFFFFSTTREDIGNIVNCIFFFAEQKKTI